MGVAILRFLESQVYCHVDEWPASYLDIWVVKRFCQYSNCFPAAVDLINNSRNPLRPEIYVGKYFDEWGNRGLRHRE